MPAITQRIPPLLGGVSQQPDNAKNPAQVRDCLNAVPDVTFGLIKRSGAEFICELKDSGGEPYGPPFFGDYTTTGQRGKWFTTFRDQTERYVCCIKGNQIYVWDLYTGTKKTVNYGSGAQAYLTGQRPSDYHVLSVSDYTFITNRLIAAETVIGTTPIFPRAFVQVKALVYNSRYTITIGASTFNVDTPVDATAGPLRVENIVNSFVTQINTAAVAGAVAVGPGIFLSNGSTPFTITAKGGHADDALTVFQDKVYNISQLPQQCYDDYFVKVINSSIDEDDYWLQFDANGATFGPGVWEEVADPTQPAGLKPTNMPHQLKRLGDGTFLFEAAPWVNRSAGDDTTNPHPSFLGQTIVQTFFFRNRLGVISGDNVVLSASGDYYNFYKKSALTGIDSDPIDQDTNSTRPTALQAAIPVAQGLLLIGEDEQFLLSASDDSALTPETASIRSMSKYAYEPLSNPADLGTSFLFFSKTNAYTRVYEYESVGRTQNPIVTDITNLVPEWMPKNINHLATSSQTSFAALTSYTSRSAYIFNFYNEGQERRVQGWFRWDLPGPVMHQAFENEDYWIVTQQTSSYIVSRIRLTQSASEGILFSSDSVKASPRLDFYKSNPTVTLAPNGKDSKVYLPYKSCPTLTPNVIIANSDTIQPDYLDSGAVFTADAIGEDGSGTYLLILNTDLRDENLIVGYEYQMAVELPKFYFRTGQELLTTDTTCYLAIQRVIFNTGLNGSVDISLRTDSREEWTPQMSSKVVNAYKLNEIPLVSESQIVVPIHQRSDSFRLKLTSTSPLPVSLLSIQWEGLYSPRNFARK